MASWIKTLVAGCAFALMAGAAQAQDLAPLNSDTETDRINWSELQAKFGDVPAAPEGTRIGGVSKTLTNEYWRSLGEGYQAYADKAGVEVVYQAAQSEGDQLGQLSIAENLISQGFNALLLSPQTDSNLQPALETRRGRRDSGRQRQRRGDPERPALCRQRPARQRRARRQVVPEEPPGGRQGRGDRGPGRRLRRRAAHQGLLRDDHGRRQVHRGRQRPRQLGPPARLRCGLDDPAAEPGPGRLLRQQ